MHNRPKSYFTCRKMCLYRVAVHERLQFYNILNHRKSKILDRWKYTGRRRSCSEDLQLDGDFLKNEAISLFWTQEQLSNATNMTALRSCELGYHGPYRYWNIKTAKSSGVLKQKIKQLQRMRICKESMQVNYEVSKNYCSVCMVQNDGKNGPE